MLVDIDTSRHQGLRSFANLRRSSQLCRCCHVIYHDLLRSMQDRGLAGPGQPADDPAIKNIPVAVELTWLSNFTPSLRCILPLRNWKASAILSMHYSESAPGDVVYEVKLITGVGETLRLPWRREAPSHSTAILCPDRSSRSRTTINRLREWLRACNDHEDCHGLPAALGNCPARLLFVGTVKQPELRISLCSINCPSYLALSYCWGDQEQTRLLASNFDQYLTSVPELTLPATIRDTLFLARVLDIKYVWIDALCIIQDSKGDWDNQAAKMGLTYHSAYLTVCAARAKAVSEGFLGDRLPIVSCCGTIRRKRRSIERIYLSPAGNHSLLDFYLRHSPLIGRGWCLQERLLPRRRVYFTPHQMIWQCGEMTRQETGLAVSPWPEDMYHFVNLSFKLFARDAEPGFSVEGIWNDIITEYSRTSLSRDTDRLPAISGLARQYNAVYSKMRPTVLPLRHLYVEHDVYLAGHWLSGFPECLLWRPSLRARAMAYSILPGPTWSWMSVQCGVNFEQRLGFGCVANVIDYHLSLKGSGANVYGEIEDCWVEIQAPLIKIPLDRIPSTGLSASDSICPDEVISAMFADTGLIFVQPEPESRRLPSVVVLDSHRRIDSIEVGFLVVRRQGPRYSYSATMDGIIVAPARGSDAFVRVGMFTHLPDHVDNQFSEEIVKLI